MGLEGSTPLPTGSEQPGKIETRNRLLVIEVANEVVWVNPEIKAPFDIKEGESTPLGVFISNENQERSIKTAEGHGRSGILGKVIFEDTDGRRYRDVDAKGIGHIQYEWWSGKPGAGKFFDSTVERSTVTNPGNIGLLDRSVALKDASMAEEFLSHGIRTYRVVGITKLNEVIAQDGRGGEKKISVEEAKGEKIMAPDIEPVVEIRAFGTRARVQDMESDTLSDAIKLVREELNLPEEKFQVGEYLHWFASTLGANIARMHKAKYAHGYITAHNVTLDCRIIDLDSVSPQTETPDPVFITTADSVQLQERNLQAGYANDFRKGYATLMDLGHGMDGMRELYEGAYRREFSVPDLVQ